MHSLTGGESFLVSLGLALALATLSSERVRVESLFIDEGFGSLDADTLNTVMEALDRLQSQGRRVGVISHVHDMAERIAPRSAWSPRGAGEVGLLPRVDAIDLTMHEMRIPRLAVCNVPFNKKRRVHRLEA